MTDYLDGLIHSVLVGRYEVLAHIGGGAMGSVYKARQLLLDREVAIKVLRGDDVDGRARRRLHREARAVARIHNPHVVQVHDYGETEAGDPYLVMDLVAGPTLSAWLRGACPSLEHALLAADGMLSGLAAAHARGVLHRDLKPANMLLRDDDPAQLVLVDFGIAAVLTAEEEDGDDPLTREGTVVGTPLYMSPEQALGQPVGPESDVYAAGIVIYEWLSGRPPFTGPVMDVMRSHAFRQVPALVPRPELDVPPEVIAVVERALNKPRDARYPSAGAMREALAQLGRAAGTQPAPPSLPSIYLDLPPTVATNKVAPELPFVGREEELAWLDEEFARVVSGRGGITFVEGIAGVGSSRLIAEFVAGLSERAAAQVGRGATVDGNPALGPVRQAVEDLLGSRSLGLQGLRQRLDSSLSQLGGESLSEQEQAALVRWLRPESGLVDAREGSDGGWSAALVERTLRVLTRSRPVVLWLDDFERHGAASTAWLESLVASQRLEPFPLWVLVTRSTSAETSGDSTTTIVGGLYASDFVTSLAVPRLPDLRVVELANSIAGLTVQASDAVAGKAAGLPLMALQLMRHLVDSGRLVSVGDRLGLADGDDLHDALPGGMRELWGVRLAAAVAKTPEPDLAGLVLDVAAGLGRQFMVDSLADGLASLGSEPDADSFDGVLDGLIAAGVFAEASTSDDRLIWEHPALVDVVLDALGSTRRGRRRAKDLARTFLSWDVVRRELLAASTVRLLELAGDSELVATPALDAGRQALAAGRLGEAGRLLRLAAGPGAPSAVRAAAQEAWADAARLAGRYTEASDLYSAVLSELDDDPLRRGRLLVGRGRAALGAQKLRDAASDLTEGIALLRPFLPQVAAARETARALAALGSVADAMPGLELPQWNPQVLLESAVAPPDRHAIAASLAYLAGRSHDLTRAVALHSTALDAARAGHHRPGVVTSLYDLGWCERRADLADDALRHLSECQRLAAALGRNVMLARVHNELGELYRERGAVEAARHHYGEGAALLGHVTGPEPVLCALNLARLDAEMGSDAAGRERLTALETAGYVPDWLLGPFCLTLAFCEAGHNDAVARSSMRRGLGALLLTPDARAGAIEILDALAKRWSSADEVEAAREARSASDGLAGASDVGQDAVRRT